MVEIAPLEYSAMKEKWFLFDNIDTGASGGGNSFLVGFDKFLRDEGLRAANLDDADVLLFNSFPFKEGSDYWRRLRKIRLTFPHLKFIHRVDGPLFLGRRIPRHVFFDQAVHALSKNFADGIIFQSEWSLRKHKELFGAPALPSTVILNGARQQFSMPGPVGEENSQGSLVVSSSWSSNPNKGHHLLSKISQIISIDHVGNNKYEIYRGNNFSPMDLSELPSFLRKYKIFIAPSWDESCSNSLVEAIEAGLTPVARNSGGHLEIVRDSDFLFTSESDAIKKINRALSRSTRFKKPDLSMKGSGQKYLKFGESVPRIKSQKIPRVSPLQFYRVARKSLELNNHKLIKEMPLRIDIKFRDMANLDRGSVIKNIGSKDSLRNEQISSAVGEFVERMAVPSLHGEKSKLTISGDLVEDGYLFSTAFAIKVSKIIGAPKPSSLISELKQSINADTPFTDKWLTKSSFFSSSAELLTNGKVPLKKKQERIVAQQRQALSAMNLWGEMPNSLSIEEFSTGHANLNWRYPWDAAAQVSHTIFMNTNFKESPQEPNKLLMDALSSSIRRFIRTPDSSRMQGVNALMKAVTASRSCRIELDLDPHEIMDLTLDHVTQDHACNHLNALLVLDYFSAKSPGYRARDLAKYASDQRAKILGHYWGILGGFSFYPIESQHTYLGIRVSHGFREPDMHGTLMFIWGLSIIENIVSKSDPQVFRMINS